MYMFENLIRRVARMIGWEITGAIESVMWSVGIGCFVLFCALCGCLAVAWQILLHRGG